MNNPKTWFAVVLAAVALVGWAGILPAVDAGGDKPAPETAQAPKPRDYSGKYLAEGTSNGGRNYKAMVQISREGDVYQVLWVLGPREAYIGVGLTEADALCVGSSTGDQPALVVYKDDKENRLVGRWTAPGSQGKTFKETLTPVK
jgi:hypothetical protein